MNRRQEREQAFILIFEKLFRPDIDMNTIIEMAEESEFMVPSEFAKNLSKIVDENKVTIDQNVQSVSIGWNTSRMSKVALAIIRLAIAEMRYIEDIPVSVSINEAVELTKKYASSEDASFVNGVLGTIARQTEN
ncbi:MAG: transcription antitermination factor NusB [Oscillospiraceae bacterium]